MNRVKFWSVAALSVIVVDAAADPVKYEFTGIVDTAGGGFEFIPPGSNVTGTLTIDFDKAQDPDCDIPPIPFQWDGCSVKGGPAWDQPPIVDHSEYVVTFEITVLDQFTYRSIDYPVGIWESYSTVGGGIFFGQEERYWTAQEYQTEVKSEVPSTNDNISGAYLTLVNPSELPFTNTGYPVFSGDTTGTGQFGARRDGPGTSGGVLFSITSLTPLGAVPTYTRPSTQTPPSTQTGGGGAIATWTLFLLLGFSIMRLWRSGNSKRRSL